MTKDTLSAKVSPQVMERLEEYADDSGISKSQASEELIKQGLDVVENDVRVVPLQADGGTIKEDISEVEAEVKQVQKQVNQSQNSVDRMTLSLVFAVLWVVSVITLDPPAWSVIPQGVVLIGVLGALFYYKR